MIRQRRQQRQRRRIIRHSCLRTIFRETGSAQFDTLVNIARGRHKSACVHTVENDTNQNAFGTTNVMASRARTHNVHEIAPPRALVHINWPTLETESTISLFHTDEMALKFNFGIWTSISERSDSVRLRSDSQFNL